MNTLSTPLNDDSRALMKLQLEGQCGYKQGKDRVLINMERVSSHRELNNLSGTVSIQLRAYRQHQHRDDQSCLLASTTIGQINGQHYLENCLYDLIYTAPSAGTWDISLEIREWDGAGYVLCDQVNFPIPMHIDFQPTTIENVIELPLKKEVPKPLPSEKTSDIGPASSNTTNTDIPPCETISTETSDSVKPEKGLKANKKKEKRTDSPEVTLINHCSTDDILEVKGLSKKVAKEIVQNRPFKKWKELLDVKGVGPKLLERIKKALKGS
ncbi:ComEA family DNA-binding protein [Marinomonas mediterranea]|uniref:ComEA family DNA-binding protein n=1 Tax=Marinomonas mediterranea TaxID=119864 RepID=UPI00234AD0E5|nr:helix-hairpin-helix domain-containing protein [Marinomonas mediterranea]WCN11222.1 hypothetical protein GV055_20950 [Marinomonas mediterranea]